MRLLENEQYRETLVKAVQGLDIDFLGGNTIVVTGATGMLGSCIVDIIVEWNKERSNPCSVVAVSRNEPAAKQRFGGYWNDETFTYVEQDICKTICNFPKKADYIIHAASNADPVGIISNPVDTLLANVLGTANLLEYGKTHDMKRFLFVSSGEVYGQPDENMSDFDESYCGKGRLDYTNPRTSYPSGKRAAEVMCQSYIRQYGMDAVIVRPCHLFGPTITSSDSRAVSEFLRKAALGEDIELKSAGAIERSHCYVVDAACAVLYALNNGICGEAYNIADPKYQMLIRDFAERAAKAGGSKTTYVTPTDVERKGYSVVSRAVIDSGKLFNLGWRPRFDNAICDTIEILRAANNQ